MELDLEDVYVAINLVNSDEDVNKMSWDVIHRATHEDGTMLKLMDHIRRGMPNSGLELDKSLREYHRFRHDPHVVEGVLCYRDCMVVPAALRTKVLMGFHGVSGMARRIVKTTGLPVSLPSPDNPFQMILADYFSLHGHNFLVIADRFTAPPGTYRSTSPPMEGHR